MDNRVKLEGREGGSRFLAIPEITATIVERIKTLLLRVILLSVRYYLIILVLVIVSNIIVLPVNYFTFNYFYHATLVDSLDTRITVNEIQNTIKFIEKENDQYGSLSDIIEMDLNLRETDKFSLFNDDLDYDFDLNLNIFCNSALDDYLIINYDFILNLAPNKTMDKKGIFILGCKENDQNRFFHVKDLFPYWLNTIVFSDFIQNLQIIQTYQKNNYKIPILEKFNSEINSFESLKLVLAHNYNVNIQSTTTHDHFQYLIDPDLTNIAITKNLTTIKWFLKNFKIPSFIIGIGLINILTNFLLWWISFCYVVYQELLTRNKLNKVQLLFRQWVMQNTGIKIEVSPEIKSGHNTT